MKDIKERQQLNRGGGGSVFIEPRQSSQFEANNTISFTDQVLNMKEFTSLLQPEASGPSNTTHQRGTGTVACNQLVSLTEILREPGASCTQQN